MDFILDLLLFVSLYLYQYLKSELNCSSDTALTTLICNGCNISKKIIEGFYYKKYVFLSQLNFQVLTIEKKSRQCFTYTCTYTYQKSGFKNLCLPICKTVSYYYSFSPSTIKLWNYLSESVNNSPSLPVFKTKLKSTKVSTSCKYFNVGNRKKIFYIVNIKMMLPILMPT